MRAFGVEDNSPGVLQVLEVPAPPAPGPGQVQLQLLGTSFNPVDSLIAGGYGAPLFNPRRKFPVILGRDAVARVVSVGAGVRDMAPGQRVLVAASPQSGGTYADLFNLPRRCLAPIDDRLSDAAAASIGYAGMTALQALAVLGISPRTARGKQICINGASGGVGSIALLLASCWGAQVTAVASSKNHAWLQALAPCTVRDYRDPAALVSIRADLVLNCATPDALSLSAEDPLLHLVHQSTARHRAYATTITPVLGNVTQFGVARGLAASGAAFLKRSLKLRLEGVSYRWVLFKESPTQLFQLAEFFSQRDIPDIVGIRQGVSELPIIFNETKARPSVGKAIFMVSHP